MKIIFGLEGQDLAVLIERIDNPFFVISVQWIKGGNSNYHHRIDGPAIQWSNGNSYWYQENRCTQYYEDDRLTVNLRYEWYKPLPKQTRSFRS